MNQNSTAQSRSKKLQIDKRTAEDIRAQIAGLAGSYVPEWHFDPDNPDIGSTLSLLFADQMEYNIERYNQVLDNYHTEFVNMLDISLLPAKPARATVVLGLVQDTVAGTEIPRGTKLLAEAGREGESDVVFETDHNLYVTNAQLSGMFMTDEKDGHIIPLLGEFTVPLPVPDEEMGDMTFELERMRPFTLFGEDKGIDKNLMLFYHSSVFDVEENDIYVRISGNEQLVRDIADGKFVFQYYGEDGFRFFDEVMMREDGQTFRLRKSEACSKVEVDGKEYSLLILLAVESIHRNYKVENICFSSEGSSRPVEYVGNGVTDLDVDEFDPFGDTLSLYQECYIGNDSYFNKAGSLIRMKFRVDYPEHLVQLTPGQEDDDLKIIKRKPKVIFADTPAEAYAEEISLEYFNGIGWKKLVCSREHKTMFAQLKNGEYEISFLCPQDWQPTVAGAYMGRCIRMQLLKSDNCYMRPCTHHYPHITGLTASFSYEGAYVDAERIFRIAGTTRTDLTKSYKQMSFNAFTAADYNEDALYLGFRRRMESGPVSLLFLMDDSTRYEGIDFRLEYSGENGFKPMKWIDHTAGLSHSGILLFMPPADMHRMTLEGQSLYWMRLSRKKRIGDSVSRQLLPHMRVICLNAAMVSNIETRSEEDYFIEEVAIDMQFPLGVNNILNVDVWVNEKGRHSRDMMQQMLHNPELEVRAEYDIRGEISAFYVKWKEAEQLDGSAGTRCYALDRMNNMLIFGDGVHTDIPRVLDDVAFKATVHCCNGQMGNVGAGRISSTGSSLVFIDGVINPVRAYGGSNMESFENALERGANILRSRRRLVSESDYRREIMAYSDNIAAVRCVAGRTADGKEDDRALSIVLLLKDYKNGSYSFHNLSGELKEHLLASCELAVGEEDMYITEPVFVDISVDMWAESVNLDDSFAIQGLMQEQLRDYLDPVGKGKGTGWEIGVLPKKSQLFMKLNVLKSKAIVKKMVVTASYSDENGYHEMDLEDVRTTPFMICRSGAHHVHIMLSHDKV